MLPRPPAELANLVDAMGADATLRLIEAFGGARIAVPTRARDESALTAVIGQQALSGLVKLFGGMRLSVPLAKAWRAQVLRERDGLSHAAIAQRLVMSQTSVERMMAALDRRKRRELERKRTA